MAYLSLPGTTGSYALAPYRSEYNEGSILDLRIELDYDAYSGAQSLVNRWSGSSATSPWMWYIQDRLPILECRDSSNSNRAAVGDANFSLTSGTRTQLRCMLDTSSNVCRYYQRATGTALTSDSGWTQVGTDRAFAGNNIQQPTQTGIQIGATNLGGTTNFATGKVYRAVVKKGATSGGTLIFDADFEDATTWVFA